MARSGNDPQGLHAQAKLEQQLANPPVPAYPLTDEQMVVWDMVVHTRAPEEWSGIDTYLACDLAVATIALRDARTKLAIETPVVVGARGGNTLNPLVSYVASLVHQQLRLAGRLRLSVLDSGEQTNVTTANARRRKRQAEERQRMAERDELIPRPRPQQVQ